MAESVSLSVINEQIFQKTFQRDGYLDTVTELTDRIAVLNDLVADLNTEIADLQATINASNSVPTLTSLSLLSVVVSSSNQALTVTGTGFVSGSSAVHLNGAAVATGFVSATSLTCTIPSALMVAIGSVTVKVVNTAPGGGISETLTVPVVYAAPALVSIATAPTPLTAPGSGVRATLTGSGFHANSLVYLNGDLLDDDDVVPVSATEISVDLPDSYSDISGRNIGVYVRNITPGGGISETVVIDVV